MTEATVLKRMCPLDCPDTCSLDVTVEEGRVTRVDGNEVNPFTEGYICGKVRDFAQHVYHPTRLLTPLVRARGAKKGEARFEPASWDTALALVASKLRAAREKSGGESILPCYYGGSNGKLTQDSSDAVLFRRLGASRLARTLCAMNTTMASVGVYGGMPGIALSDYVHAELVVVWGANPHASGIHFVPIVQRAQAAGAKLVVIDPRRTKLALKSDLHLALRPGTDLVLALALVRWLFANGKADEQFLAAHANDAAELRRRAEPWTIERAAAECGLTPAEITRFAELYARASPAALRCGWGLERNRNGCAAIAAVLTLPAVAGKFGVLGGGYTMSNGRAFQLRPAVSGAEADTRVLNQSQLGRLLLETRDPAIEVLFVYNANPLATFPDQERVRRGLEREDLFTVVSEQVMTDTARYADVVLPATTFLEHSELRNGYGTFALMQADAAIAPVGEARPNYEVFAELIRRLDLGEAQDDFSPLAMVRNVMVGNEDAARAIEENGIAFPPGGLHPVQFVDTFPRTSDKKIHLVPPELEAAGTQPFYTYFADVHEARYPLALISPSIAQLVSSSFGELLSQEVPLGLHPDDARARRIGEGDTVRVWNELGEVVTSAHLDAHLRPGVVELPKGLWSHHTRNGATSNALVPDTVTDGTGGACFNDARVEVERIAQTRA